MEFISKSDTWKIIESQVVQMKASLLTAGASSLDVSLSMSKDGSHVIDWGSTGKDVPGFAAAMDAPQANGPTLISASGRGEEARFCMRYHDTEHSLRDATVTVLENLAEFAAATSGLASVARTEIFGPTGDDAFPLVMLQGLPVSCGWNPPEAREFSDFPEINAQAHSDDFKIEVAIDARPYLVTADVEHLKLLGQDGWRGDYTADEIFHRAESAGCPGARRLQDYISLDPRMLNGDTVGFEVSIDEDEAMSWLAANRPEIHASLTAAEDTPSL